MPICMSIRSTACWTAPAASRTCPKLVQELGQTAVAITDHGVMYGAIDFYRACMRPRDQAHHRLRGVCRLRAGPGSIRSTSWTPRARHLVLLCENEEGYRNLSYLVSHGLYEGFYIKPRIDLDSLRRHTARA
ncbi:MAG: PHP domain-containing protein [Vescimonas sp.]